MSKTTIYLSEDTAILKKLALDVYFPETELHTREIVKLVPALIGKSFCTHSEVIINYIGQMIDDGNVAHDSIEINIIEPWKTDEWQVRKVTYDEQGYLVNWQLGFFDIEIVK